MLRQIRYESAQRYYLVRCARNLFGDLVLSRYWGGLGSRTRPPNRSPRPP